MPFDRKSETDGVFTYLLVRPNPGVRLRRLNLGIKADATLGAQAVGYMGFTGDTKVQFMFSVEPTRRTVTALDNFLTALPPLPSEPPTEKDKYAALSTDSDRISFIAAQLRLT